MTQKMGPNIFESLFRMTYEPCYVDNKNPNSEQKNHYPTIFSALSSANYNSLIKINQGLYVQKIQLKTPSIKMQSAQPTTNAIIANQTFPSITVQLPSEDDKVSLEGLKFAHICQNNFNMYKPPSWKKLKQNLYRGYKICPNMNTNLLIKRGTVYLDECRFSLSTQKDQSKLVPSIVVEKQGTLIMSRCELRGGVGTIGILLKGGKITIRQCSFKNGAIGILAMGNKLTSIIVKNCIFSSCIEALVLAGPFQGTIENNIMTECLETGMTIMTGNKSKILNNQIKQCKVGIHAQNCCPIIMKNIITKSQTFAMEIFALRNTQCWAFVKLNFINQNQTGGIHVSGIKNKSEILNNQLNHNNLVGIKVDMNASPHILLNHVSNTLGNGVHIHTNSTAFLQKNVISGSLQSNVVIEGPNNIGNYLYNNIIEESRGDGLFLLNSEKFLISNNKIRKNNNGILSVTSVVNIEQNVIERNKQNGVLLVQDNFIQFTQNQVFNNRKAGLAVRNSSSGQIKRNTFKDNSIEILVENGTEEIREIDTDNTLPDDEKFDIRIPKNYYFCQLI